jgi:hypothetical protein
LLQLRPDRNFSSDPWFHSTAIAERVEGMNRKFAIIFGVLVLAGCNQPDPNQRGSDLPIQNPPTENPSPQTGTGGDSQTNPPADSKQQ